MFRKYLGIFLVSIFVFTISGFAQEEINTPEEVNKEANRVITGKVESIAEDASSMVVSGQTILISPEFLEDSYLETGDNVKVTVEETEQGLKAVDYEYVFEEDEETPEADYE